MPQRPLAGLFAALTLVSGLAAPGLAADADRKAWSLVLPPRRPTTAAPTSLPPDRVGPASARDRVHVAGAADDLPAAALPVAAPAGGKGRPSAGAAAPLSPQAAVDRANAYFNGLSTIVADFTQIGGDGRRVSGKLYLQRPGKLRFEYDAPSALQVIADGTSVAVRDRNLATQDLYLISQTPLKFLLRDTVNLGTDIRVTDVASEPGGVRIALEDRSTLGGTSKILLYFDPAVENLSQWRITDPQGFVTTVILSNVERSRRVDQSLFVINYERFDDR
jgi:outer membrane lipoprotein-sorting protein